MGNRTLARHFPKQNSRELRAVSVSCYTLSGLTLNQEVFGGKSLWPSQDPIRVFACEESHSSTIRTDDPYIIPDIQSVPFK